MGVEPPSEEKSDDELPPTKLQLPALQTSPCPQSQSLRHIQPE
jgi:hypothetical protein